MYIDPKNISLLRNEGLEICVQVPASDKKYTGTLMPFCYRPREREIGVCLYNDCASLGWMGESTFTYPVSVIAFVPTALVELTKIIHDPSVPQYILTQIEDEMGDILTPKRPLYVY